MRYVKYLIDQVRRQTENEDVTEFTGIQDSEFLQYLNDAQHNLQALITQKHPNIFIKEKIYTVSSGVSKYEVPGDCYLGNKILNVEFSSTGKYEDYYPVPQDSIKNRNSSYGMSYIRLDSNLILNPLPQMTGYLKVTYVHGVDNLNLRKAAVNVAPTMSSTGQWQIVATPKDTTLSEHDFVCIVDKRGNMISRNIGVDSIAHSTNTSTLTLDAHTPDAYDSTIEVGHYVIGGKNATSHSGFDSSVERYLIAYAAWKILKRDSSIDSQEAMTELNRMAREIVDSYALINDDLQFIPEINDFNDWS